MKSFSFVIPGTSVTSEINGSICKIFTVVCRYGSAYKNIFSYYQVATVFLCSFQHTVVVMYPDLSHKHSRECWEAQSLEEISSVDVIH